MTANKTHAPCPVYFGQWYDKTTGGCSCGGSHREWQNRRVVWIDYRNDQPDVMKTVPHAATADGDLYIERVDLHDLLVACRGYIVDVTLANDDLAERPAIVCADGTLVTAFDSRVLIRLDNDHIERLLL